MPVLNIFDAIGDEFFGEVSARTVLAFLKENEGDGPIDVRINSPGGDVFEGVAIYNLLVQSGREIRVEIDGLAASAAADIAMAGNTIAIAKNGMLMVHEAWGLTIGNKGDHTKTVDLLSKIDDSQAGVFATRTGKTKAQVAKMLEAETWMTADEAKAEGFVDSILAARTPKAKANAEGWARCQRLYKHAPEDVDAMFKRLFGDGRRKPVSAPQGRFASGPLATLAKETRSWTRFFNC